MPMFARHCAKLRYLAYVVAFNPLWPCQTGTNFTPNLQMRKLVGLTHGCSARKWQTRSTDSKAWLSAPTICRHPNFVLLNPHLNPYLLYFKASTSVLQKSQSNCMDS